MRGEGRARFLSLVHSLDKRVDLVLSVSGISSLLKVDRLLLVSSLWRAQLEGPQKLVHLFEVLADNENLVDEVLNAEDASVAQLLGDDAVVGDGNALVVHVHEASLVDELSDGLQIRRSIGDIRLDELEHLLGGTGETDENSVVDLSQSQELQDLSRLGIHSVDTSDTDDYGELGLGLDEEVASRAGLSAEVDERAFLVAVFPHVGFRPLEDGFSSHAAGLFDGLGALELLGLDQRSGLSLLEESFRDRGLGFRGLSFRVSH